MLGVRNIRERRYPNVRFTLPDRQVACRAIIFDKDGTLIDRLGTDLSLGRARSESVEALLGAEAATAWREAVGFDLARGWADPDGPLCLAPRRDEILVAAATFYRLGQPWEEARRLAQAAYDRADELLEPPFGAELLPGVAAMLGELRSSGLSLAIATSDRHQRSAEQLAALGAGGRFGAIVASDDVVNGKPAPDMVLLACQRLGCSPAEALVVGDSPVDLQMARAASAGAAVAVTTGQHEASRLQAWADLVLPSAALLPAYLTHD